MKTIIRKKYLDRVIELKDTPDIKIITGIRRSGKSKLMQAYMEYLKNNFKDINIIFIDSNFAHKIQLCTLKIQYLAVIQLSLFNFFKQLEVLFSTRPEERS